MANPEIVLVGRSSSHFTRTTRIFALELGVPHRFQPVLDITSLDPDTYAGNPALKVPVLVDAQGSLFGTENICRELARRSGLRDRVVLRGDVEARIVANAEELILHAMGTEVILIMTGLAGQNPPTSSASLPKARRSLENALAFLDANLDRVLQVLPTDRILSFFEAALFCVIKHLPFRKVMDVDRHPRLEAFSRDFAERAAAHSTEYHFDSV